MGALAASTVFSNIPAHAVPALPGPRVPTGAKLRGLNHVGSFEQDYQDTIWGGFWRTWDWSNWIRPQMEDIAKVANSVRFWGNTLPIADGSVSLDEYLGRWEQVLNLARELGLYVYPCGGDLRHWGDFSWKQSTQTYAVWSQLLAEYNNVIGVDITNEASDTLQSEPSRYSYRESEPADRLLEKLSDLVRRQGIPVTHSRSIRQKAGWTSAYFTDYLADFLDFHVYYPAAANDSADAYRQPWGEGKELIIGEFGKDTEVPSSVRTDYYDKIRAMCVSDSRCKGAFAWSAWDLGPAEPTQWGLFDGHRQLRSDIGDAFLSFPTKDP
ncbi:Cellulase (glycosyl hydrolase family 5) [Mycolicibacterium chlorophenolicum]|uniref:Cellulase (Glycosyl hydrolase family 5) n=2 Tax=Mycolicibacterium chlorophenolicum TaxID=37916 RepID=A0A0J6YE91_9MYCO|nr:Cellulase (glycosyl hydrolase family 5) [Mycolicibacterium chlorophenolicum]